MGRASIIKKRAGLGRVGGTTRGLWGVTQTSDSGDRVGVSALLGHCHWDRDPGRGADVGAEGTGFRFGHIECQGPAEPPGATWCRGLVLEDTSGLEVWLLALESGH